MFSSPITRLNYVLNAVNRHQEHNTNKNNHLSIKKHKKIQCLFFKKYLTDIVPIAAGRIAHFADPRPRYFQ